MTRSDIYKQGDLPYSFIYKMRNAFIGRQCPICGCKMSTDKEFGYRSRMPSIQHNKPISKGGKHEIGNISIICRKCNVTIKTNETGELNNKEVVVVWNKIKELR